MKEENFKRVQELITDLKKVREKDRIIRNYENEKIKSPNADFNEMEVQISSPYGSTQILNNSNSEKEQELIDYLLGEVKKLLIDQEREILKELEQL